MSGSAAVTGTPMFPPASVFSGTSRVAVAESNSGGSFNVGDGDGHVDGGIAAVVVIRLDRYRVAGLGLVVVGHPRLCLYLAAGAVNVERI